MVALAISQSKVGRRDEAAASPLIAPRDAGAGRVSNNQLGAILDGIDIVLVGILATEFVWARTLLNKFKEKLGKIAKTNFTNKTK